MVGVLMLCGIFLYPLRKRWSWLQKQGDSKHWLDHHVVLGVAAPICIAFHSSFKFRGLAGIAFWVMVAVSLSGLIGRYLYAQVPRQVEIDEVSLRVFVRSGPPGGPPSGRTAPVIPITRVKPGVAIPITRLETRCRAGLPLLPWPTW